MHMRFINVCSMNGYCWQLELAVIDVHAIYTRDYFLCQSDSENFIFWNKKYLTISSSTTITKLILYSQVALNTVDNNITIMCKSIILF